MNTEKNESLWEAGEYQMVEITRFDSTAPKHYIERLEELGFRPSTMVQCLKRLPFGGPMVVEVGDSVFSITQDLASKVYIRKPL